MSRLSRDEVLARLRTATRAHRPILVATAGNGLIARSLESGGVDLLLTSITGLARQRGLPSISWRLNENNRYVLGEIVDEILEVADATPLIASVGATLEPRDADFRTVVREIADRGYSGILNFPTVGEIDSPRFRESMDDFVARGEAPGASDFDRRMGETARSHRADLEQKIASGNDFSREVALIAAAHEEGIFTIAYAFTTDAAVAMVEAGADVLIGHCGGTGGGSAGAAQITHEEAAEWLNRIFASARSVRSDIILMGHGGPFATAADTERLYALTPASGFLGGSALERIPVERAVADAVEEFHSVRTG